MRNLKQFIQCGAHKHAKQAYIQDKDAFQAHTLCAYSQQILLTASPSSQNDNVIIDASIDNNDRIAPTVTPHILAIINTLHVISTTSFWAIHTL